MKRARVGYARVSIDAHDLAEQQETLEQLGVAREDLYVDHGFSAGRDRPGLREAMAACRPGDTLVVTELHRLAHSVADICEVGERLSSLGIYLDVGDRTFAATDPAGVVILKTLVAVANFEADVARLRTREGLKAAKAIGRLRGKPPKLDPEKQARLVALHQQEGRSPDELAELFGVARSTVYRVLDRARRGALNPVRDGRGSDVPGG